MRLRRCCCGRWAPRRWLATLVSWTAILSTFFASVALHGCWTGHEATTAARAVRAPRPVRYVRVPCLSEDPPKTPDMLWCADDDAPCLNDAYWKLKTEYYQLEVWANDARAFCAREYDSGQLDRP